MWSGSKIGSDSQGIEEVILGTVVIIFINDIDDFGFEHILPDIYKTAHERDQFNLHNWIQSDEPTEVWVTHETSRFSFGILQSSFSI